MSVLPRLRRFIRRARREGLRKALRLTVHRAYSAWCEHCLGIHTAAFGRSLAEEGVAAAGCLGYSASSCLDVERVLDRVAPRPAGDVLVDLGSGLGRVVLMAARRPFRRVIGVEISPGQVAQARRNLEAARPKLACRDVQLVCGNAADYALPPEATLVYLFNPFGGEVLRKVIRGIERSVAEHPRRVTIVVATALRFAAEVEGQAWLRRVGEYHGLRDHVIWETTVGAA